MDVNEVAKLSGWFSQYGPALVLYASQWLERHAAEDAVQEVFLRLWGREAGQKAGKTRASQSGVRAPQKDVANVKSWLYRSVRNASIDRLRRVKTRARHEQRSADGRVEWFQSRPEDELDAHAVQKMLEALPPEQSEIIVLRIWGGLSLAEAAQVTGEPVSTLFSRYRAGLTALRQRLEVPCLETNRT
jgi:RNA polymerase sigma-70 factor (ECF subfamily)